MRQHLRAWTATGLAAVVALALTACGRTPQEATPAASGDTPQTAAPGVADGPPGGPSGVKGSAAHPGASGGDMLPGASGSGHAEATGQAQVAQPGVGLNGGLGVPAAPPNAEVNADSGGSPNKSR